jgi:hypothetical protein
MTATLEYMANLHPTLINDYRTPDNKYCESCYCIAINIAKRLLDEGKSPYILEIYGKLKDSINRESIIPKPFNGRVIWEGHQICCENNLAYDPMISSKPVSLDYYFNLAFEGEVEKEIVITKERMINLIPSFK